MNKVWETGRLTKDPEVKYTNSQQPLAVTNFVLAVDRKFKKDSKRVADFISFVAFGKTAEFIEKYFHKGSPMEVCGWLKSESYTNRNGDKVYKTQVVVDEVSFVIGRNGEGNSGKNEGDSENNENVVADDFINVPSDMMEDELPFE